jgi:hypothetical protein
VSRIDPTLDVETSLVGWLNLQYIAFVQAIGIDARQHLLVLSESNLGARVVRVHPMTGHQELLATTRRLVPSSVYHQSFVLDLAVGSDGRVFLVDTQDDGTTHIDEIAADGTLVPRASTTEILTSLAVARDGTVLVGARHGSTGAVLTVDVSTGVVIPLATDLPIAVPELEFAPSGELYAQGGGMLLRVDPLSGAWTNVAPVPGPSFFSLALDGTGFGFLLRSLVPGNIGVPTHSTRVDLATGETAKVPIRGSAIVRPSCADGLDNDGDGRIDWPEDPDCDAAADTSEHSRACGLGAELIAIAFGLALRRRLRN